MGLLDGSKYIGIDLGTSNTLIYTKKNGIVLKEPSVIAIRNDSSKKILCAGTDAKLIIGKTPKDISTIMPVRDGIIVDIDGASRMLKHFIKRISGRFSSIKPNVVIAYPIGDNPYEKISFEEAAYRAGAGKVYLIPKPIAAARGAGLLFDSPTSSIIVDMGGGTTTIAIVSMGEVILSKSILSAGDEMDQAIMTFIRMKHHLIVGKVTAEQKKIQIGSAFPESSEETVEMAGKDVLTGYPTLVEITSSEISEALQPSLILIANAIKSVIEAAPPELSQEILKNGILLTGGGALLKGIDEFLKKATGLPVCIAENPVDCVVIGAGKSLGKDYVLRPGNPQSQLEKIEAEPNSY